MNSWNPFYFVCFSDLRRHLKTRLIFYILMWFIFVKSSALNRSTAALSNNGSFSSWKFSLPWAEAFLYVSGLSATIAISIGNSMICSDIWHKYHEWYFEIVIRHFTSRSGELNLRQFWNITSGIYAKYHVQIMLLFVYTTTHKRLVICACRYFKLSWNNTALSQSNGRNFSCSSIKQIRRKSVKTFHKKWTV